VHHDVLNTDLMTGNRYENNNNKVMSQLCDSQNQKIPYIMDYAHAHTLIHSEWK